MLIVGVVVALALAALVGYVLVAPRETNHRPIRRSRLAAVLIVSTIAAVVPLIGDDSADAAIVATVPLGTAANYAVLGGSTVTNTGDSVLNGSLGLSPGSSITGFPPGLVVPPGTTDVANGAAEQAQSDLTNAYVDAAGRPIDSTTNADLGNLVLGAGVYAGPSKSPLSLTGPLILDGVGDPTSVFIFQTDSTLITASGSTVTLINGAQECNVFWLVGSSATLGTGSVFAGNILALTAITVTTGVTVHGRALARNAAVTLDTDTFTRPTCAQVAPTPTTTPGGGPTPGNPGTPGNPDDTTPTTTPGGGGPTTPTPVPDLPFTGSPVVNTFLLGIGVLSLGAIALSFAHRRRR